MTRYHRQQFRFGVCFECLIIFHFHTNPVILILLDSIPNIVSNSVSYNCYSITTGTLTLTHKANVFDTCHPLWGGSTTILTLFLFITDDDQSTFQHRLLIDNFRCTHDYMTFITFRTRLYRIRQLSAYIRSIARLGSRHAQISIYEMIIPLYTSLTCFYR